MNPLRSRLAVLCLAPLWLGCTSSQGSNAPDAASMSDSSVEASQLVADGGNDATDAAAASEAGLDAGSDVRVGDEVDAAADAMAEAAVDASRDSSVADSAVPGDAGVDSSSWGDICATCSPGEKLCTDPAASRNNGQWGLGVCLPESNTPAAGCGTSCTPCNVQHALATCSAGACSYVACDKGWGDCDGIAANGCETSLLTSSNCTACGVQCSGANFQCTPNGCASSCPASDTSCAVGGACTGLSDTANCGACGTACSETNAGAACNGNTCTFTCPSGEMMCGSTCVDTSADASNCGSCGHACIGEVDYSSGMQQNPGQACVNGACVCPPGFTVCSGMCVAPAFDTANCGACGHACGSADSCMQGACVASSSLFLTTGLAQPADIAVDAQNVYWSDTSDNAIRAIPRGGGPVVTLASAQADPARIALDSTYVYWSNSTGGTIFRAPKDGSASPSLVTTTPSPGALVVIGANVYFLSDDAGMVVAAAGGTASAIGCDGVDMVSDGAETTIWCAATFPNDVLTELNVVSNAQTTSNYGAVLLAAGWGRLYTFLAGPNLEPVFTWVDAASLAFGATFYQINPGNITSGLTASGIATSSCGAFIAGSVPTSNVVIPPVSMLSAIFMYVPTLNGAPYAVLQTSANRIVQDSGYVYWTDHSGAIGAMATPE